MYRAHSLSFTHDHGLIASPPSSLSSPSSHMPTVFVHPPEEESMPWCAFDASQENAGPEMAFTSPEMEVLQSKLDDWSQTVHPTAEDTPTFHRSQTDSTVIMPQRGPSYSSLSANRNPLGLAPIPESPKRAKERDDDDIVEVMKVRRGEGMPDVAYANGTVLAPRRSKTLRLRAAQALRSIKNVRKVPRRPTLEHVFPAKENGHTVKTKTPGSTQVPPAVDKHGAKALSTPTQSSLPRLKRRVSQPLSNLFGLGVGGSEAPQNAGVGVVSSHSEGFRTLPYSRSASASTPALQLMTDGHTRPTSPSYSTRGTRNKFSFVNLQSIFSGHSPSAGEPMPEPLRAGADPDVEDSPPPRTAQTPVDDGWDSGEDYESPRRHADPGTMHSRRLAGGLHPDQEFSPFSFETRLNSLYFDSFSFDADAF